MYHLSVKYFSRRKGQSIVAAAAYRSGDRLNDRYYGVTHDFTVKGGIVYTNILLPAGASEKLSEREILWNAVEQSEKRRDARLAREVEGALPADLALAEHIQMVERYVTANFTALGMIADIAIHDKGTGNPHMHILLTTRTVDSDGFGLKNREWDKRENVTLWRREWANMQNREFERKGLEKRVNHESYIVQDSKREPTIHLGYRVKELERSGIETDRGNENHRIIQEREEQERQYQRKRERGRNQERSR